MYNLIYKRSFHKYRNSYISILCVFVLSLTMFSFTNIYNDSYLNYTDSVIVPQFTKDYTCDIRIMNMSEYHTEMFTWIPDVNVKYIDGNLDFFLSDPDQIKAVYNNIKIVHDKIIMDEFIGALEEYPSIYIYYGKDGTEHVQNYHQNRIEKKLGILLFQGVLSVIGIAAMVLIYSNYIDHRTEDIRTLSGIGISDRQLHRLFFRECNILYLISLVIGVPLGAFIAFIYFKGCELVDLSHSNSIYPIFDVDVISLFLTVFVSYVIVYITFTIVLKKILRIDASYTCMETIMEFNPEKARRFYHNADNRFNKFFASIINNRSSSQYRIQTGLTMYSLIIAIFMLNAVNYVLTNGINKYGITAATIAESIANTSLFLMIGVFSVIYSLIIIWIFTKRHSESYKNTVQTLYLFGANESDIYSSFVRYTIGKIITSLLLGFSLGYMVTGYIFSVGKYMFYFNLWFILGNMLLAMSYSFVYWISMKKYYKIDCSNTIAITGGKEHVIT